MQRARTCRKAPLLSPEFNIGPSMQALTPPPNGQNLASSERPRAEVSTLKLGGAGGTARVWTPSTTFHAQRGCRWGLARFCPSTVGSCSKMKSKIEFWHSNFDSQHVFRWLVWPIRRPERTEFGICTFAFSEADWLLWTLMMLVFERQPLLGRGCVRPDFQTLMAAKRQ